MRYAFVAVLALVFVLLAPSTLAQVSHAASEVNPGAFAQGEYRMPGTFVVGSGSVSPTSTLQVQGANSPTGLVYITRSNFDYTTRGLYVSYYAGAPMATFKSASDTSAQIEVIGGGGAGGPSGLIMQQQDTAASAAGFIGVGSGYVPYGTWNAPQGLHIAAGSSNAPQERIGIHFYTGFQGGSGYGVERMRIDKTTGRVVVANGLEFSDGSILTSATQAQGKTASGIMYAGQTTFITTGFQPKYIEIQEFSIYGANTPSCYCYDGTYYGHSWCVGEVPYYDKLNIYPDAGYMVRYGPVDVCGGYACWGTRATGVRETNIFTVTSTGFNFPSSFQKWYAGADHHNACGHSDPAYNHNPVHYRWSAWG